MQTHDISDDGIQFLAGEPCAEVCGHDVIIAGHENGLWLQNGELNVLLGRQLLRSLFSAIGHGKKRGSYDNRIGLNCVTGATVLAKQLFSLCQFCC